MEATRILTVEITDTKETSEEQVINDELKRKIANELKEKLKVDNVVVNNIQDFILEEK